MSSTTFRSDVLAAALKMIDDATREYRIAYEEVGNQHKLECDLLHTIELEPSYDKRCKAATQLKDCLQTRRYYKDIVEETEPIVEFLNDPQTKKMMCKLNELLGKIRKQEQYHKNRNYHPRVRRVVNDL